MTDRKLFVVLLVIFTISIALLVYVKSHMGQNFINQFL